MGEAHRQLKCIGTDIPSSQYNSPKHHQSKLYPRELVTIGILFALKVSLHHLYLSGQVEWPASPCSRYVSTIL